MEAHQDPPQDLETEQVVLETSLFRKAEHHVWRNLASGFWVLVPVLVTYLIFRLAFIYVDGFFRPLVKNTPLDFPGVGVIIILVGLYVVGGALAGERLQRWQDAVLTRIPIIKGPYTVARQATAALSMPMGKHFNRVVFVEWPRPGVRTMGFVTGYLDGPPDQIGRRVAVYIPTVPNPTSGMLAFFAEGDTMESNISVPEAMKTVLSGGIVLPVLSPSPYAGLRVPSQTDESAKS